MMVEGGFLFDEGGADDARRDVLAILAAGLREDYDDVAALMNGANESADAAPIVVMCLALLVDVLHEHGADPLEWVTQRQAEHVASLAQAGS